MTSLKVLTKKQTTFCHASVTTHCATLFRNRRDAENHDYDMINAGVFVVCAHNPDDVNLCKQGDCSFCEEDICGWVVARYNDVYYPDDADFEYADKAARGDCSPSLTNRPWHRDNSGGCYVKDADMEGVKNDILIYDIIICASEESARVLATKINMDSSQFYHGMVLPCHNADLY